MQDTMLAQSILGVYALTILAFGTFFQGQQKVL